MANESSSMPPVGSFLPNSDKYRSQQTTLAVRDNTKQEVAARIKKKEPLEKVGTSTAVVKEKTFGEKMVDAFIAEDTKTVGDYLVKEKIVPEVKEFALDLLFDGLSMLLGTKRRSSSGANRTDYSTISTSGSSYRYASSSNYYASRKPSVSSDPYYKATSEDPCEIIFKIGPDETPNDAKNTAKEVLSNLRDAAEEYGTASVADLYELSGISPKSFTDNSYGWNLELLSYGVIKRVREGYSLELPKPIPID